MASTELYEACSLGRTQRVMNLIHGCQDVYFPYYDIFVTPLWIAAKNGFLSLATALVVQQHADINKQTKYYVQNGVDGGETTNEVGETPLFVACKYGHSEIVRMLIEKGADVTITNTHGESPIFIASCRGFADIVEILLELSNPDVNLEKLLNGATPLFVACQNGHCDVVKLLLEKGKAYVDKPRKTEIGETPLYIACYRWHVDIVKILIEHGANANFKTAVGDDTPLFLACALGRADLVSILLYSGHANTDLLARGGISAVECARKYDHKNIIMLIRSPILSFLCGHHHRCGASSPLLILPPDILVHIGMCAL